jgi:5'-3' exonuclease
MNESVNKKKLFSIFENLNKEEIINAPPKTLNSEVLIIDLLNLFIRCYSVFPNMNDNGNLSGGLVGSLRSMAYAIKQLRPTRCIVVADGAGGSKRRKEIYPDYKSGRKNRIRVNRMYSDIMSPDMEEKSMKDQLAKFVNYLHCLPITLISVDNIEADDTIAYLATTVFTEPNQSVTIMSADKDFLQLVNNRVKVWSPTKKKLYGVSEVVSEYGIHPHNFVLFRCLDGDTSDNIDGIKGAGLKTSIKCFPELVNEKQLEVDYLKEHAEQNSGKFKLYENVLSNWEIVERNYKLMQLKTPDFAVCHQHGITDRVNMKVKHSNIVEIVQRFTQDGIHDQFPMVNLWIRESFGFLDYYTN